MSSACPSPNRISYLWRNLNVEHLSSCTFLRCSLLALSSGRGNRLFKLWAVPTGPWCFKHLPQNSWNDTIEWELTYCSVWLFFRYSLFQPCAFRLCCLYSLQEDVIENVHSAHQRMDWGGGGCISAWPDVCLSLVASLAFQTWCCGHRRRRRRRGMDVIENSEILADEMIGAAAFLVVRGNEGRAVCVCAFVCV